MKYIQTDNFKLTDYERRAGFFREAFFSLLFGVCLISNSTLPSDAADYADKSDRFEGGYLGVLGNYTYANAEFVWDGNTIIDRSSHNWGIGGVAGYGWTWGAFYFGPEVYLDYADISDTLSAPVSDVLSLSIERQLGAGANLLVGFTGFDDTALFYGLIGGGATNFSGGINVVGQGSLSGDLWYPVLTVGAGMDWAVSDTVMVRAQAKHTFYYDASDTIFPSNTNQSYNLDTTTVSIGLVWRPWQ